MATYSPPKRATEYIFYVGLVDSASPGLFKAAPTLAAGDVTVSKDGGTAANITTLPTVTPAGGKRVKVTLSSTEMDADNVTVVFSDASGAEWDDLIVNIAPSARQIDDLLYLAAVVEGSLDIGEVLRILLAEAAGKASGGGTTSIAFRDQADTKDRIAATVDANGNRTAVTLDGA